MQKNSKRILSMLLALLMLMTAGAENIFAFSISDLLPGTKAKTRAQQTNRPVSRISNEEVGVISGEYQKSSGTTLKREEVVNALSRPTTKVGTHSELQLIALDGQKTYDELEIYKDQDALPEAIHFRDNNGSYTRSMEACLYKGNIYIRHRNQGEKWRVCPMPEDLKGKVTAISMDSDEIIAMDKDNWIYLLSGMYEDGTEWRWSTGWGELFCVGAGYQLPNTKNMQWALSNIDPVTDTTYIDGAGKEQPVGGSGCTQIFYIDPQDDANILYTDPWLPADQSRAIGSPEHSRFKIRSMSSSGSCTFVTNKYGKMYTRLYDYDIGGGDVAFFRYTWTPDETKEDESYTILQYLPKASTKDYINLPSPYWVEQPAIPGTITDRISVESTDNGMNNRRLKVEGEKDGKTGYWTKMLEDKAWTFVETGDELQGKKLKNTQADDLKDPTGVDFTGTYNGATIECKDFAWNDSRQDVTIIKNGKRISAKLYYEYGSYGNLATMILDQREYGLTDEIRPYHGALYLDEDGQKALGFDKSIVEVTMSVTKDKIVLNDEITLNRTK